MAELTKLPQAELELMQCVWEEVPPVSTNQILERLQGRHGWKPQTVLTLLTRLIGRGFLSSERVGRERVYVPLVGKDAYLAFESAQFVDTVHLGSVTSLVSALYQGKKLSQKDVEELRAWLDDRG